MEDLDKEYLSYFNSIKDSLPKNVVQLSEISMHDVNVESIETPSKETFIMNLDCEGGFNDFSKIKLTFTGVKEISMPENIEEGFWLYDEIYLTNSGFELHVLFDIPFTEFKIEAENILIEAIE